MREANKSFEIRTAQEYLTQLVHESHNEFEQAHTSARAAITCALFTWHLHDWVWAQYKDSMSARFGFRDIAQFVSYLFEHCSSFTVIRGIANGSKHFDSDQEEIKSTKLQQGFAQGLAGLGTVSHLTVDVDGSMVVFIGELRKCVQFWDQFFQNELSAGAKRTAEQ